MSGFKFTTTKNYLKRDASTGTATVSAPSTLVSGLYRTEYTIVHDLGYVPLVRVYFESEDNDVIFPACGSTVAGFAPGIAVGDTLCTFEVTTTTLVVILFASSSQTGSRDIYWVIYKDSP